MSSTHITSSHHDAAFIECVTLWQLNEVRHRPRQATGTVSDFAGRPKRCEFRGYRNLVSKVTESRLFRSLNTLALRAFPGPWIFCLGTSSYPRDGSTEDLLLCNLNQCFTNFSSGSMYIVSICMEYSSTVHEVGGPLPRQGFAPPLRGPPDSACAPPHATARLLRTPDSFDWMRRRHRVLLA